MLPQGVTTLRIPECATLRIPECAVQVCAVPNKAIMNLVAVFQTNLIIINHPHGPSLASNIQKNSPKIFNETRQVRVVWTALINPVFHLTISIICFTIDTALSNNKETNIVIVGVAKCEEKPCNQ